MILTAPDRQALVRGYVLLALGAVGALRIFLVGASSEPLVVGLTAALLGITLVPKR